MASVEEAVDSSSEGTSRHRSADERSILTRRRVAWVLVVGFFVVGDVVTTAVGVATPGVSEFNPSILSLVAAHGFLGVVVLKGAVVAAAYLLYRIVPRPHDVAIPVGFGLVGLGVTIWNVAIIGTATFH